MKKGFTLVELLAVIALLGTVILVATPSLIKSKKDISAKDVARFEETLKDACEAYVSNQNIDCLKYQYKEITLNELINNNYISGKTEDPKVNKKLSEISSYTLTLCENYKSSCTYNRSSGSKEESGREILYVSSTGSDIDGIGEQNKPFKTIQKAYDSAGSKATIIIQNNITLDKTIHMNSKKDITITSTDNNIFAISRNENFKKYMINHRKGTLTLQNITFDGKSYSAEEAMIASSAAINTKKVTFQNANNTKEFGSVFRLQGKAKLNIDQDSKATNNTTAGGGSFVFADANSKVLFTLNGGTIQNNSSKNGTIWIGKSAKFIMNSGTVSNNTATDSGAGVFIDNGGMMEMNGGNITNNKAANNGGGIFIRENATLTINSGTLQNNTMDNKEPWEKFLYGNFYADNCAKIIDNIDKYNYTQGATVRLSTAINNGQSSADIVNSGTSNGTNIQLYANNTGNNQKWNLHLFSVEKLNNVTTTLYIAKSEMSSQCMNVSGDSNQTGSNVQTWIAQAAAGNYWYLEQAGSNYYIKNIRGLCLHPQNGSTSNGTNVQADTCGTAEQYQWKISQTDTFSCGQ